MKTPLAVLAILCLCVTVCASPVENVVVKVPDIVSPNEKFNISIEIKGNLPIVVGVLLDFPREFVLVNCSESYKVLKNKLSLAIINNTNTKCTFKAPLNEGVFTIEGKWIDMLNKKDGTIKSSIFVGSTVIRTNTTTTVTTTSTPNITATTAKRSPDFEFLAAVVSISSIVALRRWSK